MKTMKIKITGIRPIILHNGLLADPTNPIVLQQKAITAKKAKKTDADNLELARLEWFGGLYLSESGRICIPCDNIERCIQQGGQKQRIGKDVQAGVFVQEPEIEIDHPDISVKKPEKLYGDPRFMIRKGVKIQTSRIIRIRPMIPTGWTLTFTVEFDETLVNARNLEQAILDAGTYVGLGDWRPKFGRFTHEII
jgi:hypothetical protein